jgi:N-acetylglucosamine malate deacetylase 1
MGPAETAELREKEAAAAANVLGIAGIEFWRAPDGALRSSGLLARKVAAAICERKPNYLYTTHGAESHSDHRAAMRLAIRGLDLIRQPWPVLRSFEIWTPLQRCSFVQDISPHLETKLRAIRCYASQCANLRFDEAAAALNRYRGAMHRAGDYAEAFLEISEPVRRDHRGAASQALEAGPESAEHGAEPGVCKT